MKSADRPIPRIIEHCTRYEPNVNDVFEKLRVCRTEVLGEKVMVCEKTGCSYSETNYASCKSTHCERCSNLKRQRWMERQFNDILPNTSYNFLTYKVPEHLSWLFQFNQIDAQKLIFTCMNAAMKKACQNKYGNVEIGSIQFLHTWNQKLLLDYHLHIVMPCGVLRDGNWESGNKYVFPFEEIRRIFKGRLIKSLIRLYKKGSLNLGTSYSKCIDLETFRGMLNNIGDDKWKMHVEKVKNKKGVERVKSYLGKTLFTLPITSSRIQSVDEVNKEVSFVYRHNGKLKKNGIMTVSFSKFLKRLSMHFQPKDFKRVRQYGFLSCNVKKDKLKLIFAQLDCEYDVEKNADIQSMSTKEFIEEYIDWKPPCCPACGGRIISRGEYIVLHSKPPDLDKLNYRVA